MRERLSAFSSLSRFPPSFHGRRQFRAVSGLHRTTPAPRRDNVGHAAGFFEDVKLPGFVMLPAPLPDGALPTDVTAATLAFNPFEFLDFVLLRPDQLHDRLPQALRAHPIAPGARMLAPPLALGALQADVVSDPFTFDPPVLLNFLSPGPNHGSDRIIAFMPCFHNVPSLWDHDEHLACRRRSRAESVTTQCRFLFKLRNSRSYVARSSISTHTPSSSTTSRSISSG